MTRPVAAGSTRARQARRKSPRGVDTAGTTSLYGHRQRRHRCDPPHHDTVHPRYVAWAWQGNLRVLATHSEAAATTAGRRPDSRVVARGPEAARWCPRCDGTDAWARCFRLATLSPWRGVPAGGSRRAFRSAPSRSPLRGGQTGDVAGLTELLADLGRFKAELGVGAHRTRTKEILVDASHDTAPAGLPEPRMSAAEYARSRHVVRTSAAGGRCPGPALGGHPVAQGRQRAG